MLSSPVLGVVWLRSHFQFSELRTSLSSDCLANHCHEDLHWSWTTCKPGNPGIFSLINPSRLRCKASKLMRCCSSAPCRSFSADTCTGHVNSGFGVTYCGQPHSKLPASDITMAGSSPTNYGQRTAEVAFGCLLGAVLYLCLDAVPSTTLDLQRCSQLRGGTHVQGGERHVPLSSHETSL